MIHFLSIQTNTTSLINYILSTTCSISLFLAAVSATAAPPPTIRETDNITKILRMESEDTITINGVLYKVPAPWQGHRLHTEVFTFDDFALIPKTSAYQNSKLYLLKDARNALVIMLDKAKEDGIDLIAHSAYRSIYYQRNIFIKMMAEGRNFDDIIRYVAPPGYSEHMLGTVVDFYPSNWEFASLASYTWLRENARYFGFFETYPQKGIKGQPWEPWHWRYKPDQITMRPLRIEGGVLSSESQAPK